MIGMSWEDIIKNDMEQYERRMLSREKRGDVDEKEFEPSKLMDELKKAQDNLGHIIETCESSVNQILERPELADKKYIEDTLSEIIKIAKQSRP